MVTQRIDDLREPPVVGRFYFVPTIHYTWFGLTADWPIIGPLHEDRKIINFPKLHYHVDARFLSEAARKLLDHRHSRFTDLATLIAGNPLAWADEPHPEAVYKRKRCARASVGFPHCGRAKWLDALQDACRDRIATTPSGRLICPHKGAPLDSQEPDADGVVTCPLHGLRWHRATGLPAWGASPQIVE